MPVVHTGSDGPVNDDWILATAAALAERPQLIRNVFVNDAYSKEGIFQFQFSVKGEPTTLIIDDQLPVSPSGSPVNARQASDGSYWVALLEKALAKLYVNYANLHGGTVVEALRVLTGKPVLVH